MGIIFTKRIVWILLIVLVGIHSPVKIITAAVLNSSKESVVPVRKTTLNEKYDLKTVNKQVPDQTRWYLRNILNDPFIVRLIKYLIVYFLVSVLILLSVVYFHSRRSQVKTIGRVKLKNKIQQLLSEYLFGDEKDKVVNELKIIKKRSDRQLLINEIEMLLGNLSGEISDQLKWLYLLLGLEKDSVHKLISDDWETVIRGIKELETMNLQEETGSIKHLLNHRARQVRISARYAYIKMSKDDPWHFLDDFQYTLTTWDQLNLYSIVKVNKLAVPEFSRWLNSPNLSVLYFSLKMIALNNQLEAAPAVMQYINHENEKVRRYAIETLSSLYYEPASSTLRVVYFKETPKNKRSILKTMLEMQDQSNYGFLVKLFAVEEDYERLLLIAKALYTLNEKGIVALEQYKNGSDVKRAIVQHVFDERIE